MAKWIRLNVVLCILVALMWPRLVWAQLAPTGGHYAGRASDTGHEPGIVNISGGYAVSVPLELPAARGGLPVPLQITYGVRGVGAAGLGWDVPLSYVRADDSFAGRRPALGDDTVPRGRLQISLTLQGRTRDLVPKGQAWVARHDAPELILKLVFPKDPTVPLRPTWVLYDGLGRTYRFDEPAGLAGAGLWLLSSVSGPGGASVRLEYDIGTPSLPGGKGVSIDLVRLLYNGHPDTGCAKHEVRLTYGDPAASPLSLSMLGEHVLARMRTLSAVDVASRGSCNGALERLRRYELSYLPDADTQQPRLRSVQMLGRQGTAEQNTAIPVAAYTYGTATHAGKLRYQITQKMALPSTVDHRKIASTEADATVNAPSGGVRYATWQSLTDVTGDGRPDFVFPKNGRLWVARNRPGANGSTTLGAGQTVAPLADATFANGAFEVRTETHNRFTYGADNRNVDQVWRQAIDVNGDGRMDIIDAAEQAGQWIVYLNTPSAVGSGVKWERRSFSIAKLYHHLFLRGHKVSGNFLPLARRFTSRDRIINACWKFDGTHWVPFPGGWNTHQCFGVPNQLLSTGPEKTFTEWEVKDINGDGYPDVVFNSSPADLVLMVPPTLPGDHVNDVRGGPALIRAQPRDGDGNKVNVVLNVRGVLFDSGANPFSAPVDLKTDTLCGVGLWAETGGTQGVVCSITDVNGDGLADRIEGRDVFLGTGRGFSNVQLRLPGPLALQESPQVKTCIVPEPDAPGDTPFHVSQTAGLHDLTGDGIPDYVERVGFSWRASIGTGTGFADAIDIEVLDSGFLLSAETERCDGTESRTTSGLYDIDGDGKPEVVTLRGPLLLVFQIAGGAVPRTPEAGRLVQVENGYGAKTKIAYRSAKEDGTTLHQVPFPEVVVTSVETTGTLGLGGTLSATQYAYGGAELMFDSALDAFTLPGYRRSVALRVTEVLKGKRSLGRATLTDTYGLAPFAPTPKNERFGRYLKAGRVSDVTVLNGNVGNDPWALLATDLTNDTRRIASTHYDWATRLFEEPADPNASPLDCMEMAHPFDFAASFAADLGPNGYDVCTSHGFVFGLSTDSWRGDAAPPSASNVATRSVVRDIDDFGRVITVLHQKDRYRSDDDICVETHYATPTGQNERMLAAPASRRVWDCTKPGRPTYAAEYWEYDQLPLGSVSSGFVTSHTVERRATDDGTLLKKVRAFDARYDVAGNPASVTTQREDGAARTLTFEYDPFGLAPVRAKIDATGVPPIEVAVERDPISLDAVTTTDANQTQRGFDFDGFGRVTRSTVTSPGGALGVLSTISYIGFSGSDPLGRRIVTKRFTDPVAPESVADAVGRTGTMYLDELGRQRRIELALGADYANETLVVGSRTYDDLGRVAFEADPFPSSQNAATAYGTSYHFKTDGTPACFVRGRGPQPVTSTTDESAERYPTCCTRSFSNHEETLGVNDAASLLASSPQAGVTTAATLSAVGRVLSRSTWHFGTRLEHATFTYDRLGQLTGMTRFQDAAGAANPVQWSWRLDSLGQVLQWLEPESAPQFAQYSDWGELLEVRWIDATASPSVERRLISKYDALGRETHHEERNNGVADPETVDDYRYDVGVTVAPQVTPANLLGRLAQAKAPTGEVFFSYDAFGRTNARVFTDGQGGTYVEKTTLHADSTPSALEFWLPDTGFQQERVAYRYDSAARLRAVKFSEGATGQNLYEAVEIDPFGRVRKAKYGDKISYAATYADLGRRLMQEVRVSSAFGSRRILFLSHDPLGRERVRREIADGAATGPKTNVGYDALGRLALALQSDGATQLFNRQFTYDALGNVLNLADALGTSGATLSYRTVDRDRICRIGYGAGGLGGTACNVIYDGVGNIIEEPTRTGFRRFDYFASGNVRSITQGATAAHFRYDAFGSVQELDLQGGGTADTRHDRRYGGLIERRDQRVGGSTKSFISRKIPGPGGILASRRGPGSEWVFPFGEPRGNRFFSDTKGAFVQDLSYQPYGEAKSSGAQPGSADYTNDQWNGGDALSVFGLSHLGARLYDPAIGRFLSRDPLLVPRTAATTNPYAFALNDPLNRSDPSGLDCNGNFGKECTGPSGAGFPGEGPSSINDPRLYFPSSTVLIGANPQAAYQPPSPTTFSSIPTGPQTLQGKQLKAVVEVLGGEVVGGAFDFDTLAAAHLSPSDVLDRIAETPEVHAAIDEYNANLDKWASRASEIGWTVATVATTDIGVSEVAAMYSAARGMLGTAEFFGYSIPKTIAAGSAAGASANQLEGELENIENEATMVREPRAPGDAENRGYAVLGITNQEGKFHSLHGTGFPNVEELRQYSEDDLQLLRDELQQSVRLRIQYNIQHGYSPTHGKRQAAEQALIRSIDKLLKGMAQ